ncbi:hypothetical protein C8J57DRAFT_1230761 [Mycena rebaudengoi]|nr:hypothetical protein C8J57DRAFT_1230761 [Mycena rebaudengoi]
MTEDTHPFNALCVKCLTSPKKAACVEEGDDCACVQFVSENNEYGRTIPHQRTAEYPTNKPLRAHTAQPRKTGVREQVNMGVIVDMTMHNELTVEAAHDKERGYSAPLLLAPPISACITSRTACHFARSTTHEVFSAAHTRTPQVPRVVFGSERRLGGGGERRIEREELGAQGGGGSRRYVGLELIFRGVEIEMCEERPQRGRTAHEEDERLASPERVGGARGSGRARGGSPAAAQASSTSLGVFTCGLVEQGRLGVGRGAGWERRNMLSME